MGITKQRRMILSAVAGSRPHMTAEEIFLCVKAKLETISEGTVYRNLNILSEEGLVKRLFLPNSPVLYESNPAPHGHVVCAVCGKVEDIFLSSIEDVGREAAGKGVNALSIDIVISQICESCKSESGE